MILYSLIFVFFVCFTSALELARFASGLTNVLKGSTVAIAFISLPSWANTYEDKLFKVQYPDSFVISPKPVKTHATEFLSKSENIKGYNFGVTMDPVKINNIKDFFKEPSGLANKLVEVEKSKEGVFDVTILNAYEGSVQTTSSSDRSSSTTTAPISYIIEYKVDSSRGLNHYLVKSVIVNKKLYVATVQSKEDNFATVADEAKNAIESLQILDS